MSETIYSHESKVNKRCL